jgi:hypothetical protein
MRARQTIIWLPLLLAFAMTSPAPRASAQAAPRPFARAFVEPDTLVTVGQPVTVRVEVLVPTWFTGAPFWPNVDLHDALTIFQYAGGYNFSDRVNGESWAGQARNYIVYPQRPGTYLIDEIPIDLRYSADGRTDTVTVSPPALSFRANLPPEAAGLSYFIASNKLEISQVFDVAPDTLREGDAFRRTITVTVENAMGMVVPPLAEDSIPGLGRYVSPPLVGENFAERGEAIIGTRVESITYVAEEEGRFRLPPVELSWWDLGASRLRREVLPAIDITVLPALETAALPFATGDESDATGDEGDGAPEVKPSRFSLAALARRWGPIVVALAALAWLLAGMVRRYGPGIAERLAESRRARAESEASYFRAFRKSAGSGDPRAAWRDLTTWLDRRQAGPGSIRAFVQLIDDPALTVEIEALDRRLFGAAMDAEESNWSGAALARRVARARKRMIDRPPAGSRDTAIQLNPRR